jgi:hypothetical protein
LNYWSYLNIFSVEGNGGADQSRSRFQVNTVLYYGTQGILPCTSIQNTRYFVVCDLPINLLRLLVFSVFPALAKKEKIIQICSVADPRCLSRIPDPDFYSSRIPDPKTATKERGEKKFVVITFYVATNFTKLQIIFVLKS